MSKESRAPKKVDGAPPPICIVVNSANDFPAVRHRVPRGQPVLPRTEHDPMMHFIYVEMRRQGLTWLKLEARAGLGQDTLRLAFVHRYDMKLRYIRMVLAALGYDLAVTPRQPTTRGAA